MYVMAMQGEEQKGLQSLESTVVTQNCGIDFNDVKGSRRVEAEAEVEAEVGVKRTESNKIVKITFSKPTSNLSNPKPVSRNAPC